MALVTSYGEIGGLILFAVFVYWICHHLFRFAEERKQHEKRRK